MRAFLALCLRCGRMDIRNAAKQLSLEDWLLWFAYWNVDRWDGIRDDLRGMAQICATQTESDISGIWPYVEPGLSDAEIEQFLKMKEAANDGERYGGDQATD